MFSANLLLMSCSQIQQKQSNSAILLLLSKKQPPAYSLQGQGVLEPILTLGERIATHMLITMNASIHSYRHLA